MIFISAGQTKMEEKIVKTQVKLKKRHQEWLNKTNKLKPEQKKKTRHQNANFVWQHDVGIKVRISMKWM